MEQPVPESYQDFWRTYLKAHSHRTNRLLHYIGIALAVLLLLCSLLMNFKLLVLVPIFGYGFSWFGHFVFEKNKPATFRFPFWSFFSDFKMFYFFITGRIDEEIRRVSEF